MQVSQILIEIDSEIARLQQARNLLAGEGVKGAKRGKAAAKRVPSKKRRMTAEGRRRIAEAMKRRWAERRKEASAKAARTAKA
ncbi:MAG: hypothetical protein JO300_04790 [Silvibacterium sp.]|nr:hypothetical protein [Silvibacterium sp.]